MTHTRNTPASQAESLVPDLDEMTPRAARAWRERMAVSALGGGRYAVETESGGSYTVDLPQKHCSCPDHTMRGERCKHLRRVAIEITEGRLPQPGFRAADCRVCGRETFVPESARLPLCEHCSFAFGERVRDRETGDLLVVVRTVDRRADEVEIEALDVTVASHPSNRAYDPAEPVVEAVYPGSGQPYSFPRSRLARRPRPDTAADSAVGATS
jgi:ribosomal protein L37E